MPVQPRISAWPALLLGFALGGFFDGILLHQMLQWHHLLSDVAAVRDLRMQLLFDGVFHALMYLIGVAGLWGLWRGRACLDRPGAGARLAGLAALGFGSWHGVDAVLSHWILGIHRIRGDAAEPLLWDLGWLVVFGLVPVLLGVALLRRAGRGGGPGSGSRQTGRAAAAGMAALALLAGPLAALPSGGSDGPLMVVFAPGVGAAQAFDALAEVDARALWTDRAGGVWAVRMDDPSSAWRLYGQGAWLVGPAGGAWGCLGWLRPASV